MQLHAGKLHEQASSTQAFIQLITSTMQCYKFVLFVLLLWM